MLLLGDPAFNADGSKNVGLASAGVKIHLTEIDNIQPNSIYWLNDNFLVTLIMKMHIHGTKLSAFLPLTNKSQPMTTKEETGYLLGEAMEQQITLRQALLQLIQVLIRMRTL